MAPDVRSTSSSIQVFCGGAIGVSILSAIAILFLVPNPTIFQYRLTIALVCFAISSVALLLFSAKVEIKGSVGGMSLTVAGSAALWLAATVIFSAIFPESSLSAAKAYDLRLNLIFPDSDPANPFKTTVKAFVRKQGSTDEPMRAVDPERGVGGLVVELDRISPGDRIHVVAEQEGRSWRSNDMIAPNTHLQMNKVDTR